MNMATGIDTYIVKVASLCNLNCSYCYYYNGADSSYRGRPKLMSPDITKVLTDKIIAHAHKHDLSNIDITLHGGEPLLIDKQSFVEMMQEFDRIDQAGITTRRQCQTNSVLLDPEWIDLLTKWHIWLGISMDGPKAVHDEFRVDHAGRGSYDHTLRGLQLALANESNGLRTSVISVINPGYAGAAMYQHLRSLGVKRMDFLLPESNYAYPPPDYVPLGPATPYGDFLIDVFDAWIGEDNPDVLVRLLDRIIRSCLGKDVQSDVVGGAPVRVAVIETDGSVEPTDNFKACANGMTNLGLNIRRNDFDDLYYHAFFKHCIDALQHIPSDCQGCTFLKWCAGGRVTHRYSAEEQFAKRTIYCRDLYKLYDHVQGVVQHTLDANVPTGQPPTV